jgi:hypothetical protein
VPLIVDEAHGAHFTPAALQAPAAFPRGALEAGADAVVHSTHKVLTAMTQAAMLHTRGERLDAGRVARALQVSLCGLSAFAGVPVAHAMSSRLQSGCVRLAPESQPLQAGPALWHPAAARRVG